MKKLFFFLLTIMLPRIAYADAVEVNGIYYNLNQSQNTAEVVSSLNKYSGDVIIPEVIEYMGTTYTVNSIGESAFAQCIELTSISIPQNVTSIGSLVFSGCVKLKEIILPDGIKKLQRGLFNGCSSLVTVHMPVKLDSIDNDVFRDCASLKSIDIPQSVTYIGGDGFGDHFGYTFLNCKSLEAILIPDGVKKIPWCAFQGCTNLKSVELGEGVTTLDRAAFGECNSLEYMICKSEEPPYVQEYYYGAKATNAFLNTNISNIKLFVPQKSKEVYKSQKPWYNFASIRSIGAHCLKLGSYGKGRIKYKDKEIDYLYETIDVEPDEEVVLNFLPDEGYDIAVLKVNGNVIDKQEKYVISQLKEDTEITVSFSPNWYKLNYVVDNETYKEYIVSYGSTIEPEPAPTKEGYIFSGWSEIPETMPAHDVTITGTFTINKYKVTYMIDGEVYQTVEVEYGSTITPPNPGDREGYDFAWGDYPSTMPAEDITINGSYTATDIKVVLADESDVKIYTVSGKPLNNLQKGVNILRYKDGRTQKLIIK